MSDRSGVLALEFQRRAGDGWPVVAELRRAGELPLRRDGLLQLDLLDVGARTDHGRALGEAVFSGAVGEAWTLARARCPDRLHVALRIDDPELRALRWEALHGPIDGGWTQLRLDQRTPLALEVTSESERSFPPLSPTDLRALVLVTSPTDLADYGMKHFDTLAAVQCAREALAPIACDVLAFGLPDASGVPTLESLCARLTGDRYAILHVVCHGAYARGSGETVLYLADDDETTAPVPADKLIRRLGRLGGEVGLPPLAFLCACESAAPDAERALGGLGRRLVRELGLPAVVAMSDRISVDTATALIGPFYRQLAAHGLPDLALAEASTQIPDRHDIAAALAHVRAAGVPLVDRTGPKVQPPPAPPPAAPIFALTALPLSLGPRFVGRERDLAALQGLLSPETGAPAACVVGPAGFGKTRLALEFTWRERPRFPGGIFWLSAAQAERRDAILYQLLAQLDPSVPPLDVLRARGESPGPRLAAAVRALNPGRAKLWVLEDIPEPAPGAAPFDLPAWCPALGDVAVLAVSRARLADPGVRHLELGPLDLDAGAALLSAAADDPVDPALARAVAEWVGGLPLALELLGKSLALGDLTGDDLRELLAGGSLAAALGEAEAVVDQAGGGSFGLLAAMRASYASLTPGAQRLARLLAQLGPDPLPMALVKAFGADASRPARAALAARSFVTGLSGHVFGTMHRVLADFLRGEADGDEPARARDVLLAGLDADAIEQPARWRELDAWAVHAAALLARLPGGEADVELALRVGRLLFVQERLAEALAVERRAVALAERSLPPEHELTQLAHLMLAASLFFHGDCQQALALQERALSAALHRHGPDHLLALGAQRAVAHSLHSLGERRRARELYETLLDRWRRRLGPDTHTTMVLEVGLATTRLLDGDADAALADADRLLERLRAAPLDLESLTVALLRGLALYCLGRLADARAQLEALVDAGRELLGPDHSAVLEAAGALVLVLRAQGELARARDLAADNHARQARQFGDAHPLTLGSLAHLARLVGALGDWARARDLLRPAADTARARYGPRHPVALTLRYELGVAALNHLDVAEARAALHEAADLFEVTAGPDHPSTLFARAALAEAHLFAGDVARARAELSELSATVAARLGDDHPDALNVRSKYGLTLLGHGPDTAAAALALYDDLVARSRHVLGDSHPSTLLRTAALARARLEAGDPDGAVALSAANLPALVRVLGDDHDDTSAQRTIAAAALRALGRPADAEPHARAALAAMRPRFPAGHPRLRDPLLLLGLCLSDQGKLDEAHALLTEVEPLCAAQLGEHHPATLSLRFDLAAIDLQRGEFAAVVARLGPLLPVYARLLGADDLVTLLAGYNLAVAEARLGRPADALARLRALVPRARAAHGDHPHVAAFAESLANLEARYPGT